jgi:hypothetical protein
MSIQNMHMHGPYERFLEKFGTSDCNLKESVVYDVLKVDS